jgi:hypothetical protein
MLYETINNVPDMRNMPYLLVICLFTACSEIRYMGIETYMPSDITYPETVKKVLIVNNALAQEPDTGYEFTFKGVSQDTCRAHADSALLDACRSLGTAIAEADYFDDVLLFDVGTHKDEDFPSDTKLTTEEVQALCEETGTDAVIAFDFLVFTMKKDVIALGEGYYSGTIHVDVKGIVRNYLPGKEKQTTAVLIADSLLWTEWGYTFEHLEAQLPTPDNALRTAAGYVGSKIHAAFVPHWNNETRWYFTGIGARWKEASVFAAASKWESAFQRWKDIHDNAAGWKDKAKSAPNLALVYELSGDLQKALELATVSCRLFEKNKGDDNAYTQLQKQYMLALEKRILDDKKLNLQFGEE